MGWQDRQYDDGPTYGGGGGYGGGGEGLKSWLGGMPAPGKAVKALLIVNIAMFVVTMLGDFGHSVYDALAMNTALVFRGQVWRLYTFTFLHAGAMHLLFNMIGLYFLGMLLERHWGAKRFFWFYTAGGLCAVAAYVAVTAVGWLGAGSLVGASGGVLAILGACAVLFPGVRVILVLFPVPIRLAATLFTILFLLNLLGRGENAGGDACHIAGLAFGVAWGYRGHIWMQKPQIIRARMKQGAWEAKKRQEAAEEAEVDRILAKVHDRGIGSLTRKEKRLLEQSTRRQQEADRRQGL